MVERLSRAAAQQRIPPGEYEQAYYHGHAAQSEVA
jgi:hypothetical protein